MFSSGAVHGFALDDAGARTQVLDGADVEAALLPEATGTLSPLARALLRTTHCRATPAAGERVIGGGRDSACEAPFGRKTVSQHW